MTLVPAICTQCGSTLKIDPKRDAAVCPYCNTAFITEKAINNYNTTVVNKIGSVNADVVYVFDNKSVENLVKSAETFIKINDYGKAFDIFHKLSLEYPYDYRGWWGMIRIYTNNFTNYDITGSLFILIEDLYENVKKVIEEQDYEKIKYEYMNYINNVKKETSIKLNQLLKERETMEDNKTQICNKIHILERIDTITCFITIILTISFLIWLFVCFLESGILTAIIGTIVLGFIPVGFVWFLIGSVDDATIGNKIKMFQITIDSLEHEIMHNCEEYDKRKDITA